jgi:hypothetical protein
MWWVKGTRIGHGNRLRDTGLRDRRPDPSLCFCLLDNSTLTCDANAETLKGG